MPEGSTVLELSSVEDSECQAEGLHHGGNGRPWMVLSMGGHHTCIGDGVTGREEAAEKLVGGCSSGPVCEC